MKKLSLVLAITTILVLTSCSSGWSCKSRYCKSTKKTKIIEQKKNA